MKITVLGSGTCTSGIQGVENRYPPGFLVEWDGQLLLLDCSELIRTRIEQAGYSMSDIHHVAITHPHQDHCAPIHFLQAVYVQGLWGGEKYKNKEMALYAPDHIINGFMDMWRFHAPEMGDELYPWPKLRLEKMSRVPQKVMTIGSGRLSARSVWHGYGRTDAVAFRLETPAGVLAYSGDTGVCEGIKQAARGADIFICEASCQIGQSHGEKGYGHLNPYEAGTIAHEAGAKKLLLVHYTGLDKDEDVVADCRRSGFTGDIVMTKDFQVFTL